MNVNMVVCKVLPGNLHTFLKLMVNEAHCVRRVFRKLLSCADMPNIDVSWNAKHTAFFVLPHPFLTLTRTDRCSTYRPLSCHCPGSVGLVWSKDQQVMFDSCGCYKCELSCSEERLSGRCMHKAWNPQQCWRSGPPGLPPSYFGRTGSRSFALRWAEAACWGWLLIVLK